jgi:hypothetical protein
MKYTGDVFSVVSSGELGVAEEATMPTDVSDAGISSVGDDFPVTEASSVVRLSVIPTCVTVEIAEEDGSGEIVPVSVVFRLAE